jgi:histone acetyltransferase HTATIP
LLVDGSSEISVEEIGAALAMTTNDVLHTLQNLNMLRYSVRRLYNSLVMAGYLTNTFVQQKNHHVIVLTNAILEQRERQKEKEKIKGKRNIDPERLQWKPPVFSAASRTWNW